MFFTSPLWLVFLLPWLGVTLWLLWGRRKTTAVPFLHLWHGEEPVHRARRWVQIPFAALLAALLAMLLTIVGAARPAWRLKGTQYPETVTLILDRGITMSTPARQAQAMEDAAQALASFGPGPLDLVAVPDGRVQHTDRAVWKTIANRLAPTLIDTHESIPLAVRQAMARTSGPVIVVTDHPLSSDSRMIVIPPAVPLNNVGITQLSARQSPRPQVMVTVRNQSDLTVATLSVRSGGQSKVQPLDLPPRGQQRHYFVDLAALDRTIVAEIHVADDLPADNTAYLVRRNTFPVIEVRDAIPLDVRRVIDAYARARPPVDGVTHVTVATAWAHVDANEPAVIIANDLSPALPSRSTNRVDVVSHPITSDVDWQALRGIRIASSPQAEGDELLRINGRTALAVRKSPARRVWVGFDAEGLDRSTDFVVFWTHVLDWVGQVDVSEGQFDADLTDTLLDDAWHRLPEPSTTLPITEADPVGGTLPGMYRRSDGALRAIHVPPIVIDPPQTANWRDRLTAFKSATAQGLDLTPGLLFVAMGCMILAAWGWPKRRLTRFSPPRTV